MQVIDSHVTVTKGLDDTPFRVQLLPDGGHLMEFDGCRQTEMVYENAARLYGFDMVN